MKKDELCLELFCSVEVFQVPPQFLLSTVNIFHRYESFDMEGFPAGFPKDMYSVLNRFFISGACSISLIKFSFVNHFFLLHLIINFLNITMPRNNHIIPKNKRLRCSTVSKHLFSSIIQLHFLLRKHLIDTHPSHIITPLINILDIIQSIHIIICCFL